MKPARERRRHQRQDVLLPLRVTDKDATGKLIHQGHTINVGAGGVYFRTLGERPFRVGERVHVIIDVPPEMFQLLPFGGMTGSGEVVRVEIASPSKGDYADGRPTECGVALRMISRLRFDPDLHLPRFNGPDHEDDEKTW